MKTSRWICAKSPYPVYEPQTHHLHLIDTRGDPSLTGHRVLRLRCCNCQVTQKIESRTNPK